MTLCPIWEIIFVGQHDENGIGSIFVEEEMKVQGGPKARVAGLAVKIWELISIMIKNN